MAEKFHVVISNPDGPIMYRHSEFHARGRADLLAKTTTMLGIIGRFGSFPPTMTVLINGEQV